MEVPGYFPPHLVLCCDSGPEDLGASAESAPSTRLLLWSCVPVHDAQHCFCLYAVRNDVVVVVDSDGSRNNDAMLFYKHSPLLLHAISRYMNVLGTSLNSSGMGIACSRRQWARGTHNTTRPFKPNDRAFPPVCISALEYRPGRILNAKVAGNGRPPLVMPQCCHSRCRVASRRERHLVESATLFGSSSHHLQYLCSETRRLAWTFCTISHVPGPFPLAFTR